MRITLRVWIVAFLLVLTGCHKRTQPVAAAAQPDPLPPLPPAPTVTSANEELVQGEYFLAARDFRNYLEAIPDGGERDQALFGLALLYSIPENPNRDPQISGMFVTQLATEFPSSPLTTAARLFLSLQSETTQLTDEVNQLRVEVSQRQTEILQIRESSTGLSEALAKAKEDADRLTAEVERREQRIRQLNSELERLIRIDSERRPRP